MGWGGTVGWGGCDAASWLGATVNREGTMLSGAPRAVFCDAADDGALGGLALLSLCPKLAAEVVV